jgi:adenylosuccinate synthase
LEGWCANTYGIKKKKLLPKKAQQFIKVIEKLLNIPIVFLSNGPDRNNIISLKKLN